MTQIESRFQQSLDEIRRDGLYKSERVVTTAQDVLIKTDQGQEVINFCANNYLGLANHPVLIEAAIDALKTRGLGMASVRFICGTQDLHKQLEQTIADFFGTEDAILYSSCFDANTGLFETLLGPDDAIISDALNHASIIDGIRLCKAKRLRYEHSDMNDLENKLKEAQTSKIKLIATDGVFSMDGEIAKLDQIVKLAEKYGAMLMVDDSHATGVIGNSGRGSAEHHSVLNRVDIFTSTLGKALGGASGGFTAGRRDIIDLLRQRSRPYLFSNTMAPPLVAASIKAFELITQTNDLQSRLRENTAYFRERISQCGFDVKSGTHPIVPVMLYDATLAQNMSVKLLNEGIYVIGFSYPVVPRDQARIRIQLSAKHTQAHLDRALNAFYKIGKSFGTSK